MTTHFHLPVRSVQLNFRGRFAVFWSGEVSLSAGGRRAQGSKNSYFRIYGGGVEVARCSRRRRERERERTRILKPGRAEICMRSLHVILAGSKNFSAKNYMTCFIML